MSANADESFAASGDYYAEKVRLLNHFEMCFESLVLEVDNFMTLIQIKEIVDTKLIKVFILQLLPIAKNVEVFYQDMQERAEEIKLKYPPFEDLKSRVRALYETIPREYRTFQEKISRGEIKDKIASDGSGTS